MMGLRLSNLQRWMIDQAILNNASEPDAARRQNSHRDHGCDLYFSEVLQGYFKLRPRWPLKRLRIEYADEAYYWVERAAYSRLSLMARIAAFIARRAAKGLAAHRLVVFRTYGICLYERAIDETALPRKGTVEAFLEPRAQPHEEP
jgi:hypothetical protein